jgi:hypothetical protein
MYALNDGMLFIKSGGIELETYRIPFGPDLKKGFKLLQEYTGVEFPPMWIQQGERYLDFKLLFGEHYEFIPQRDAFDYIYLQSDLANLSGKKYHSKRNHISAFTKKYNWRSEVISEQNIPQILECMEEWYIQNSNKMDELMLTEKDGVRFMLENMQTLNIRGLAIFIEDKAVAFTLGSPINRDVFDVHIEKALPEYATAYTVINNEFAKYISAKYPDVQFLMVNATDGYYETVETAKKYVEGEGYSFTVLFDTKGEAERAYNVMGWPTTYFINANGEPVASASGTLSYENLQKGIGMITE